MSISILNFALSSSLILVAALVIGHEVSVRWALILEALNFREPGYVKARRAPVAHRHSVA